MFQEIKKTILEAEESKKLSSVVIYQDNIESVCENIDTLILQIRSLIEANSIGELVDNGVINIRNVEMASDKYEIVYRKLFNAKNELDSVKDNLAATIDSLNKTKAPAPTAEEPKDQKPVVAPEEKKPVEKPEEKKVVAAPEEKKELPRKQTRSEAYEMISDYAYIKENILLLNELFKKKPSIHIQELISSILSKSWDAVKQILKQIDLTKQYSDEELDKLILTIKEKLDKYQDAMTPKSLEDILFQKNIMNMVKAGRGAEASKAIKTAYLGV